MHNMIASCASFNRLPYVSEIEEMAKSLVITYPCLRDAETGHVSIVFFLLYIFSLITGFVIHGEGYFSDNY